MVSSTSPDQVSARSSSDIDLVIMRESISKGEEDISASSGVVGGISLDATCISYFLLRGKIIYEWPPLVGGALLVTMSINRHLELE